ncbi:MAG TPA: winged helix-turn-helix domain-containing protein [Acidobacteriaceae bacterium]|nr:winged helix-turn-helix domain-containing protein [Acidobacteriaceae bacterium]
MSDTPPARRYRFGVFEADPAAGELRRAGVRIRLHAQPFQVLTLLLARPGEILTREEISRELWPDGTFVDYEHGVNSAVNRLREALGDKAANPRFVETLARRGYRFVAPVESIATDQPKRPDPDPQSPTASLQPSHITGPAAGVFNRFLAQPEELPSSPQALVRTFYLLLQLMYIAFYVGALANLPEINDLLSALPYPTQTFCLLIVTAALLIPVRAFLATAVLFHPPGASEKVLKLWPFLLPFDLLWALSPFLLLHHINFGLALACTTLLVYAPFAQRSLVLMGATVGYSKGQVPEPQP